MNTTYTYPNAIIYGIKCNETGEVYIGSTVRTLEQRMSVHRRDTKRCNTWITNGSVGKRPCPCCSIQILNRGNYTVFEIEPYPCNTKTELCLREGDIQMQYKSSMGALCINMCIAGALARAGGKVGYEKQYNKQYRIDNAEKMREQSKQYNKANSAKIAAKHNCSLCGGRYTHGNKAQHCRSQKHQRAMCINTQAVALHDS
jgi:hypothetical protein